MYNLYFYANKRNNNCDQTIVRIIFIVLQRVAQRKSKYKLSRMKFFCYRPLNRNFYIFLPSFPGFDGLASGQSEALKAVRQREEMGHHMRSSGYKFFVVVKIKRIFSHLVILLSQFFTLSSPV